MIAVYRVVIRDEFPILRVAKRVLAIVLSSGAVLSRGEQIRVVDLMAIVMGGTHKLALGVLSMEFDVVVD